VIWALSSGCRSATVEDYTKLYLKFICIILIYLNSSINKNMLYCKRYVICTTLIQQLNKNVDMSSIFKKIIKNKNTEHINIIVQLLSF
jgi:hypothetical protein